MPTLPLTTIEKKAWNFAKNAHSGTSRKFTNSTYFDGHIAKVFGILKQYDTRPFLGAVAILHDSIEDVDHVTFELIVSKFGEKIANLVMELTSDDSEISKHGKTKYLLNKMINMSSDALLIKLCDRLQNISDMYAAPSTFRVKYYKETKFIIDGLKRKLTHNHLRIISQINALLENIKNRNKFEKKSEKLKFIKLFEDFKQNNITIEDIIKCIDNGGIIYATNIKGYKLEDEDESLIPISVDNDGQVTVDINGSIQEVDIKNITKIEYN